MVFGEKSFEEDVNTDMVRKEDVYTGWRETECATSKEFQEI